MKKSNITKEACVNSASEVADHPVEVTEVLISKSRQNWKKNRYNKKK